MLKKITQRRRAAHRHRIAMNAANEARRNANFFNTTPTPTDVTNLAYGTHGIHLTDTEARDALAAALARYCIRLTNTAA